MAYITFDSLMT